jgi:CCR4-NOT transcription complex subunit 6
MFNNTNQHLLNGGGHRGFGQPLNSKPFQHQNHPLAGHHNHQDGAHSGHAHQNNYHHQHSHSGGTGVTNGGHFGSHLNGTPGQIMSLDRPHSEHWQLQVSLQHQERDWNMSLPRARNAQGTSKSQVVNASLATNDIDKEERQRPGAESTAKPKDQIWTELDMGGNHLRVMTPFLFEYDFLTKLYFNNNKLKHVPKQISRLRGLKVLDLSINDISSLPPTIGMLVNLKELLLFDNHLRTLPDEVGNLFQCHLLGLAGNPLDEEYKSILMEQDSVALIKYLRENAQRKSLQSVGNSNNIGLEPPPPREWMIVEKSNIREEDKITILNYNTLCHHYCTTALYGYTASAALSWEHRRETIMSELRLRNADFMCFQEMEYDAFETFFRPALAPLDYKGVFWPKGRAKTMAHDQAKTVDGCATFYKHSKYAMLDKQVIDIPGAAINRPDMKGEADIYNRVMPKDNIAVVTFFENRQTGVRLVLTNAHLHWDQQFKDVKVVQAAVVLDQIAKLSQGYAQWPPMKLSDKKLYRFANGESDASDEQVDIPMEPSKTYSDPLTIPMIFTGDFNSLPDSGPYRLILNGSLPPDHEDLEGHKYGNFTKDGITHPFSFDSAYKPDDVPFTNYVSNFRGVVDYIWFAKNCLELRGVLGPVEPEYLAKVPGFPNVHFPSDHLAIMAEFGVKRTRQPGGGKYMDRD